uniref:Uncharacterized protein n=1 Tax=Heterosigma akashiwo TaxID=2829 RepID=A0A6T5PVA6_HETAK|mmetsp:Transcript_29858/g.54115  ORF Transcript_29858/g.54115 Transcript_29858/m.54115 type:complete len:230 (+) Transcript_29858:39-728(+)
MKSSILALSLIWGFLEVHGFNVGGRGLPKSLIGQKTRVKLSLQMSGSKDLTEIAKAQAVGAILAGALIGGSLLPGAAFAAFEGAEPEPKVPFQTVSQIVTDIKTQQKDTDSIIGLFAEVNRMADDDEVLIDPKDRKEVVRALIEKKANQADEKWDEQVYNGYGILKRKLDPYNTVALGGYLSVAPYLGGLLYLALVAVQRALPGRAFDVAYVVGALAFFAPAVLLALAS